MTDFGFNLIQLLVIHQAIYFIDKHPSTLGIFRSIIGFVLLAAGRNKLPENVAAIIGLVRYV